MLFTRLNFTQIYCWTKELVRCFSVEVRCISARLKEYAGNCLLKTCVPFLVNIFFQYIFQYISWSLEMSTINLKFILTFVTSSWLCFLSRVVIIRKCFKFLNDYCFQRRLNDRLGNNELNYVLMGKWARYLNFSANWAKLEKVFISHNNMYII